jgi:hypothetical protein
MRIRHLLAAAVAFGLLTLPAQAQDTAQKKPGGLNKVARNVSKTMKKAGRDTKAEVRRDAGKTHIALKDAGNDTKAQLKRTTGVTSKTPDSTHKAGGLNKMARDVSHASKKAGANVKHAVKKAGSDTHKELTKTGKDAKEAAKKP